jgi:hypothetical protein
MDSLAPDRCRMRIITNGVRTLFIHAPVYIIRVLRRKTKMELEHTATGMLKPC